MHSARHLKLDGAFNTRDLGGLPTRDGRLTRMGQLFRSDSIVQLTPGGWDTLYARGVKTVIDLRNPDEWRPDLHVRPEKLKAISIPLDGREDVEFWKQWNFAGGCPLFYAPHLERFPHLSAKVHCAIAEAPAGGVLFHCEAGRDRTGLISTLLLMIADVEPAVIASDYVLSWPNLKGFFQRRCEPDQEAEIRALLDRKGTSVEKLIDELVGSGKVLKQLRRGGLRDSHVELLKNRLISA
jgi:protein tyrosine/serine phosphatase